MKKSEFIELLEEYLENTGMSGGSFNAYFSVGDTENINTTMLLCEILRKGGASAKIR